MDKIICNVCNKLYSPKYILHHKNTFFHLENSIEYDKKITLKNNLKNILLDIKKQHLYFY